MNARHAYNDERAISQDNVMYGGDNGLPSAPWLLSTYSGRPAVEYESPSDPGNLRQRLDRIVSDTTSVHVYGGFKLVYKGAMKKALERWGFDSRGFRHRPGSDISDRFPDNPTIDFIDEKTVKDPAQVIDLQQYREDYQDNAEADAGRYHEAKVFEDFFRERPELGMRVIRIDQRNDGPFKYFCKKTGKNPELGFVSRDYVNDAISELKQYDSLLEKGDPDSLEKALGIAKGIFTRQALTGAKAKIGVKARHQLEKIDWKRLRIRRENMYGFGDEASGRVGEARAALSAYYRLTDHNSLGSLNTAYLVAKTYFTGSALREARNDIRNRRVAKAVEIGENIRDNVLELPEDAGRACRILRKTGIPRNVELAKGIKDMYFNTRAVPPPIPKDAGVSEWDRYEAKTVKLKKPSEWDVHGRVTVNVPKPYDWDVHSMKTVVVDIPNAPFWPWQKLKRRSRPRTARVYAA